MSRRLAVSLLPALCIVMGLALMIEVLCFSFSKESPQLYTRDGLVYAAAPLLVGSVALAFAALRTGIEWEVNRALMAAGALLVFFALATMPAAYIEFTDTQAFTSDPPHSLDYKARLTEAGATASWILLLIGFFFYLLSIIPMKYKAKYEQEQRPSIFDLMDRNRRPPQAP